MSLYYSPHKEVHMSIEIFTRELHYKRKKNMNITVKNKVLWARLALISCIIMHNLLKEDEICRFYAN